MTADNAELWKRTLANVQHTFEDHVDHGAAGIDFLFNQRSKGTYAVKLIKDSSILKGGDASRRYPPLAQIHCLY